MINVAKAINRKTKAKKNPNVYQTHTLCQETLGFFHLHRLIELFAGL